MKVTKEEMKKAIRENYNKHSIYDIGDIQRNHIGHWFDKDTMRFFKSRVINEVFAGKENLYFVSSEKGDGFSPRLYTVRAYNSKTRSIDTIGYFQGYKTKTTALTQALKYAFEEK